MKCAVLNKVNRFITLFSIITILFLSFECITVCCAESNRVSNDTIFLDSNAGYTKYLEKHQNFKDGNKDIEVIPKAKNWDGKDEFLSDFFVAEDGFYNIKMIWKPQKKGTDIELGIKIDGEYPFSGLANCELDRLWENADKKLRVDSFGNECLPEQKEIDGNIESVIRDRNKIMSEPYRIYLSRGKHTVTFIGANQPIYVYKIIFSSPEQLQPYDETFQGNLSEEKNTDIITIQAENADIKTSKSIMPKSDNSDAGMTPVDPYVSKVNYIGGTTWQLPGETLTWKFNVEKAGYYSLHARYKQSDNINEESQRTLRVNGEVPFEEAENLAFRYSTKWKYWSFMQDEKEPYYLWLEEGENTISLEASVGDRAEYYYKLNNIVNLLGNEYIQIIMITGETPDANRDYELFKQIPNFNENLLSALNGLDSLADDMKKAFDAKSTKFIASVENMSRVLKNMIDNPYSSHIFLSDYYDNYSTLSSWLYDMNNMPLALDEIQLVPYGQTYNNKQASFIKQWYYDIVRFISSFSKDYRPKKTENNNDRELNLWVTWGQDKASALDTLIQESFTYETGIKVNLQIVNTSLINGLLTGNFPDVSLMQARTEPVNLGMRGAVADLSQFPDYKEVLKRFAPGADIPYWYNNKLFALPDAQYFFIMFARTDILDMLEIEVPKTWDEFLHDAIIIQRNNMNVYLPYTQMGNFSSVSGGLGSLHLFPTFMSQNGLSIYNESKTATDIVNDKVIDVFQYWTDFYKNYSVEKAVDFYNRFRAGTIPLGIAPYTTYMTLYAAAPEIKGRWEIAVVPSMENGNNTVAGGGTGCSIIEKSSHKEEAWEFLKWWTSADTQIRYISNVESLIGTISRPTTANVEAFNSLGWDSDDLKVLNEQWSLVRELPEIPGSYYLIRAVDQAFWEVVNGESNSRNALVKWSKVADEEISRKIKEYS